MLGQLEQLAARRSARTVLVLVLGAAVLLPRLGDPMLVHSDEGRYVGSALEAMEHGEWVVPLKEGRFNRDYGKPPLGYAVIAAATAAFGRSKWVYRLPFVLAGLLALLLVMAIGDHLRPNAGLIAALLLLASPGWAENIRRVWLESLLIVADLGGILCYVRYRDSKRLVWGAAAAASFAAALMTKQLAGGFGLAAIGLTELWRWRSSWKPYLLVLATAVFPLVVWFALLFSRISDEAASVFDFHVVHGLFEGHSHQPRKPDDYLRSWLELVGWGASIAGIAGIGIIVDRFRRGADAVPPFGEPRTGRRLLNGALIHYAVLSIVIVGGVSRSYRFWYPFLAAYVVVIGAGLALTAIEDLRRQTDQPATAIGVITALATVQIASWNVDSTWALLCGAVAWGICPGWPQLVARLPVLSKIAPHLPVVALGAVLAVGWVQSLNNNSLGDTPDELQIMVDRIDAAAVETIVAEPRYFQAELKHYLGGITADINRKRRACGEPPTDRPYAYLAVAPPPRCWKELKGRRGRAGPYLYVIGEPP